MKTALLLSLMTISLISQANANALFGRVENYITNKNEIVAIPSNQISNDGQTARFFNYSARENQTINMSDVSKETKNEISDVKAGEHILVNTPAGNGSGNITRFCLVWNLFENKQAYIGCKTYEADRIAGYELPETFNYIVNNIEQGVVAEVQSLDGFSKGDRVELMKNTESVKAGKTVKVVAVLKNGQALIESALSFLDTTNSLLKGGVERVNLTDLRK